MKRILVAILIISILALGLSACGGNKAADDNAPIKIGSIIDFSGPTSGPSTPYGEGIKAYVDWRNQNGGIEGRQIDLIMQDYAYKVPTAEQLYSQFVGEGIVAFQGWGTGDTEALRGKIADDKIPFMSASYSINLAKLDEAPYNFLAGTTYSDQMVIALQWIKDQGGSKVAILHHDSPFGQSPVPDGEDYAKANGIELLIIAMPGGATDLTPELSRVQEFGAEYIIVQNVASPAALAVRNAADLGMDSQFICLNWCADESLIELAGDAAEGVMGTLPFAPPSADVPGDDDVRAYAESKGLDLNELGLHYTQGWWTMAVMVEGIDKVVKAGDPVTGENIRAALETITNFDTGDVTAPITFSATSHRGNKSLRLYQVSGGKWTPMSDYIESNIQ